MSNPSSLLDRDDAKATVASINESRFQIIRAVDDIDWHRHDDEDKGFLILAGSLRVEYRLEGAPQEIALGPGDLFAVPRGVEHRTFANPDCVMMLVGRS